VALQIGTLNHA
jgi:hypothetical protein